MVAAVSAAELCGFCGNMSEDLRAELEAFLTSLDIQTSCVNHPPVNLGDLSKLLGVGSGNLRFADEAAMLEKLKVGQGCASALALLFDKDQSVKLVLDRDLVEGGHDRVHYHPMTNTATIGLSPPDLLRFLRETGHEPVLQTFQ